MVSNRVFRKKRYLHDEQTTAHQPAKPRREQGGLMALQQRVGNQAVQQLLAQRQAQAQPAPAEAEPVETGQLKIEKPEIKEYDVTGDTLAQVNEQILPPEEWYEYEYRYDPKIENGVVTQVDITVRVIIHLPRWRGPGWDRAVETDKQGWLDLLKSLAGGLDEYETDGQLPQPWLGVDFQKDAPEALKNVWRGMLQEMQNAEQSQLDVIRRRMLVLQQKLIGQPAEQVKTVFDQFQQATEDEEELYHQQRELGQDNQVSINAELMVQ